MSFGLFWFQFTSFCGLVIFEKGHWFDLLGYLWAEKDGFLLFHLSSMYAAIFLISDGKGLMHEPHRLHTDVFELWSFLKVWIPFSICTVISTSVDSFSRLHWKNPYKKLHWGVRSQAIFSVRISGISYTFSRGLLEANVNQVNHCFNMI